MLSHRLDARRWQATAGVAEAEGFKHEHLKCANTSSFLLVYYETQDEPIAKVKSANGGIYIALPTDGSITVEAWAREWYATYKSGGEYNTRRIYEVALNAHVIPAIGRMRIVDVKPHHLTKNN